MKTFNSITERAKDEIARFYPKRHAGGTEERVARIMLMTAIQNMRRARCWKREGMI